MLGVDQIRRVELVNKAPLGDPLPLALDGEGADPACHAGVDRLQPVLVITDIAHRLDLLVDWQSLDLSQSHPGFCWISGLMVTVPGEPFFCSS